MPIRKIDHTDIAPIPREPERKEENKRLETFILQSSKSNPKPLSKHSFKKLNQPALNPAKRVFSSPIKTFLTGMNSRLDSEDIEILSNILRGDIAHNSGKLPEELNEGDIKRYFT